MLRLPNVARIPLIAGACTVLGGLSSAAAQQFATYGGVEASGFGEGSAIIGTTITAGRPGWSPLLSLNVYSFRYRSGFGDYTTATAFAPSVGLSYQTSTSAIQGAVGYALLTDNASTTLSPGGGGVVQGQPATATGAPFGTQSSAFVSAQYIYFGDGSSSTQLLASYGFKGDYLFARGSQLFRVASSPVLLGADVTLQGSTQGASIYELEIGPAFEYRFTNNVRLTGGAGVRTDTKGNNTGGYARVGFLWLASPFSH